MVLTIILTSYKPTYSHGKPAKIIRFASLINPCIDFIDLEILFKKIKKVLSSDGVFLVSDMIGRNGHMRWPEALEYVNSIWKRMPDRYKYNHQLKRVEKEYDNWDCSTEGFEGIRAQDILPLLIENFHFDMFFAFNNIISIFIDRGFGHNFDAKNESDRQFIDEIAQLDDEKIEEGCIKPTQILATLKTVPVDQTLTYKHLTPEFCLRPVE